MRLEARPNGHLSLSLALPPFCSEKHSGAVFFGRVEGQMICVSWHWQSALKVANNKDYEMNSWGFLSVVFNHCLYSVTEQQQIDVFSLLNVRLVPSSLAKIPFCIYAFSVSAAYLPKKKKEILQKLSFLIIQIYLLVMPLTKNSHCLYIKGIAHRHTVVFFLL